MCKPQIHTEPQRAANRTCRVITASSVYARSPDWSPLTGRLQWPQSPLVFCRKRSPFEFLMQALRNRVLTREHFFVRWWAIRYRMTYFLTTVATGTRLVLDELEWKNAISYTVCVLYSETVSPNAFSWVAMCECVQCVSTRVCIYSCWECTQTVLNVFIVAQCG